MLDPDLEVVAEVMEETTADRGQRLRREVADRVRAKGYTVEVGDEFLVVDGERITLRATVPNEYIGLSDRVGPSKDVNIYCPGISLIERDGERRYSGSDLREPWIDLDLLAEAVELQYRLELRFKRSR